MKTTQEQRERWKFKRRHGTWRDLLADMTRRCRRSQMTLEVGKRTLAVLETSGFAQAVQNDIRLAN